MFLSLFLFFPFQIFIHLEVLLASFTMPRPVLSTALLPALAPIHGRGSVSFMGSARRYYDEEFKRSAVKFVMPAAKV